MAHGQFAVSDTNPNDVTGGGGCICDELQQADCKPPYIICYSNEMASNISPHVVACATCVEEMFDALGGEILGAGENSPVHAQPEIELPESEYQELPDISDLRI